LQRRPGDHRLLLGRVELRHQGQRRPHPGPGDGGRRAALRQHGDDGAADLKAGAVGSLWDVVRDRRLNHRPEVAAGVCEAECSALLRDYFVGKRHGPVL